MRVLVACFGNVLRADDGFGIAVAERLLAQGVPPGVEVLEVGIGGIRLVQELLDPTDALVVVDATDVGRPPGTVVVVEPDVEDVVAMTLQQRHDALADMHYATPDRTFTLARGLGVLPRRTVVVGCQPVDAERYEEGLSAPVAAAVDVAIEQVRMVVREAGMPWP